MKESMESFGTNRREFLAGTAMAAAATFVAPRLAPAQVVGANEKIAFAVVGCGGMGTGHVGSLVSRSSTDNIAVLAVCDLYKRRVTRAQDICKGDGYMDYREVLARPDIDAVLIATPDHWHAKIAMEALAAGKHVYCEKPMTHTVEQAVELRNVVRNSGKVFQVGPQGTGEDSYWKGHEAIAAGRIGKVTWAQGSYNRNARSCLYNEHQKVDPTAGPDKTGEDYINWDMWLGWEWGLAPKIPWTPEHFFRFRKFWPYNGGVATDLLYHKLAPLLLAIAGPNGEYPARVSASGGLYIEKDGRETPDTFLMTADYPSEWALFLVSTLTDDAGIPDKVYGKYGTMELGGEPFLQGNGDWKPEFKEKNDGLEELRIPVDKRRDMEGTFIDAIRGTCVVNCNAELGCSTMVAIKMATDSFRERKTALWDAQAEKEMLS